MPVYPGEVVGFARVVCYNLFEAEGEGGRSAYAYEGKGKKMKYEVTMSYTYEVDSDNIERSLLTLEFPEFTYGEGEYLEGNSSWKEIN